MDMAHKLSLNHILDDEFLTNLAKSADLYKIGTNTILDPEEIRIGLKVVPRAVMSLLISELVPMEINSHKEVQLPFGKTAYIKVNKGAADDFTGEVYNDNTLVYSFRNRSLPGLGIILLSTFELYDMEEISKPKENSEDVDRKVQKIIDERMELHSLVNRVVEEKLAHREAIHKMMMEKLSDALKSSVTPVAAPILSLDIKPQDIAKKEPSPKKGSPLKAFVNRKKPKEYNVEMIKSEVDCRDCNQTIFGDGAYSGCICMGQDQHKKIWIKKSDDGVSIKFSKSWDPENIEMLLAALRGQR